MKDLVYGNGSDYSGWLNLHSDDDPPFMHHDVYPDGTRNQHSYHIGQMPELPYGKKTGKRRKI